VLQFTANFLLSVPLKIEHQSTVDSGDKKSVSVIFMAQCIKNTHLEATVLHLA